MRSPAAASRSPSSGAATLIGGLPGTLAGRAAPRIVSAGRRSGDTSGGTLMNRKSLTFAVALCLALASGYVAWARSTEVVTGGHVLSAMMTSDPSTCTVAVNGSLDPAFKGADTKVDLV